MFITTFPGLAASPLSFNCSWVIWPRHSIPVYGNHVKPRNKKYFAFTEDQIRTLSFPNPSHSEGRWPSSQRGAGSGGRGGALDERCRSVRQKRVVLTPQAGVKFQRG